MLLTDDPAVSRLSDLSPAQCTAYLASMARLAAAVERVCAASDPATAAGPEHAALRAAITAELSQ
jgi:hypothetical protein